MPVYNCEEYLTESIESILNQSFDDFEFICIDDGSTDNSLQTLQDYAKKDDRIRVFHQDNKGGGTARNFALTKASGKYLLFIDSDDILYSNALKETYDVIEQKNVDFLFFKAINYNCDEDEYFEEEYFVMNRLYNYVKDSVFSYNEIGTQIFNMSVTPWGKLYNLDFIKRCGAQFAEGIIFHDNIFFWDMLFASEKIYFYNKTLYIQRQHSTSIQGSKDKRFLNIFIALRGIESVFIKYGNLNKYKDYFFNWEIRLLNMRFYQIKDEFKNLFLDEFKMFLLHMKDMEGYDNLMQILNDSNKKIYENVFLAQSANEFKLLMENDRLIDSLNKLTNEKNQLNNELNKLKNKNSSIKIKNKEFKKKNNTLKKEIKYLKNYNKRLKNKLTNSQKLNEDLLNSSSWKLTKPLRKFKNLRK